jgi:predicted GTPase
VETFAKFDLIDECKMAAAEDRNMILVMGLTGAGKSYFINKLTDENVVVGKTLRSCEYGS